MYGEIYDHGDTFFLFFASSAIVMAGFTLVSARLVRLIGSRRTMAGVFILLVVASAVNLLVTTMSDGIPAFVFFFVSTTLLISLQTSLSPLLTSGALDEVGYAAGTAASAIGVISLLGGAMLSPFVDSAIGATITPFAAGFFMFSLLAAIAASWANTGRSVARVA
jgi:MFS family permease